MLDGSRRLKPFSSHIPTSMLSGVILPSKPSFRVRMAVCTASSSSKSSLYLQESWLVLRFHELSHPRHLFSRKVFPFIEFFPMAVAFHAKYAPEGSHWNKYGRLLSHPQIKSETPNGRTPLKRISRRKDRKLSPNFEGNLPWLCELLHQVCNSLHQLSNWNWFFVCKVVALSHFPRLLDQKPVVGTHAGIYHSNVARYHFNAIHTVFVVKIRFVLVFRSKDDSIWSWNFEIQKSYSNLHFCLQF